MSRRWWCLFIASCLIGAQRAPAPIVEEPQATPPPAMSATPRPKRTTKPKATNENSETPKPPAKSSQAPQKQTSRSLAQGTWTGSFGKDNRTIVVGSGSVSVDGGPLGRESGPIKTSTSTEVTWTTNPLSLPVTWTLTVLDGGTMAKVTTKHLLGGQTGSFQKKK
jgi:hypothetical protein